MNITLHQIMADETEVYLKKNDAFGYDLEITIPDGDTHCAETGIHELCH